MSQRTVLLMEPLHVEARAALEAAVNVIELSAPDAPLDALSLTEVEALITRGRGQVNASLLARLPALKVIARAGVGLDNVDLDLASERGIPVLNVPNALATTVAEHALSLALLARRDIFTTASAARAGNWSVRDHYSGASIAGSRVAVIGMGSIGERTAALFRAVGAQVKTWNRTPTEDAAHQPTLEAALQDAQVVSLHVALTPETRHLLNAPRLALLAEGATLINAARPAVVDREALLAALDSGQVARYAIDGFDPEPPPANDALLIHPAVLVTPHTAALTEETFSNLCLATVDGVLSLLEGKPPSQGARVHTKV